jgi:hypothetical protein
MHKSSEQHKPGNNVCNLCTWGVSVKTRKTSESLAGFSPIKPDACLSRGIQTRQTDRQPRTILSDTYVQIGHGTGCALQALTRVPAAVVECRANKASAGRGARGSLAIPVRIGLHRKAADHKTDLEGVSGLAVASVGRGHEKKKQPQETARRL